MSARRMKVSKCPSDSLTMTNRCSRHGPLSVTSLSSTIICIRQGRGNRFGILFQIGLFQCFSYIIDRVHKNSLSMHFRRANTDSGRLIQIQEGQYGFRRANKNSGGPIRNRLCILGRPIRNRLCILGGPIRKPIKNGM